MDSSVDKETRSCPICHLKVSEDTRECPFCTADLSLFEVNFDDDVLRLMDMEVISDERVDPTGLMGDNEVDSKLESLLLELDLRDLEEKQNHSKTKSIPLFTSSSIHIPISYSSNLNVLNLSRGTKTKVERIPKPERIPEPGDIQTTEDSDTEPISIKPFFPSVVSRLRNDSG